jgi:N-acetylglucosamine-6-phosphate deacetylase
LETTGLTASLIPDQIHVSPALFRLLHKSMDTNSSYYTTDAMAAAGAPAGNYTLGTVQVEVGSDQIVRQPGKSNFAGSALKPIDGVFRAAEMLGVPWQQVWKRFSEIPASLMELPQEECKIGHPAHFCLLSTDGKNNLHELKMVQSYTC